MIPHTSLALCCLLAASPSLAQQSGRDTASVTLLPGWQRADGARMAGIEMRIAPGWHTYWRVPGDSGIPPAFDWSGSRNLAGVAYQWPRPEVFESDFDTTIGYTGTVILPVLLTPKDPDQPMDLALDMAFGTCSDICMADEAQLSMRIAADTPVGSAAEIRAALAERPLTATEAGVTGVSCSLGPAARGYAVTADVTFAERPSLRQTMVIETDSPDLWIELPKTGTSGRDVRGQATLTPPRGAPGPMLDRGGLRITLIDADRAIDIRGCEAGAARMPGAIASSRDGATGK